MTVKDLLRTASASVILVPTTNENKKYEWSKDGQTFEFVKYGFDAEYDDIGQLRIYETKEIVKVSDIEDKEVTSIFCNEYTSISFHIKDDFRVEEEKLLVSYINATEAASRYELIASISFKEEMDFRVKDTDKLFNYFPDEDTMNYLAKIDGVSSSSLFFPVFEIEEKEDYYLIKDTGCMSQYKEYNDILPGKISKENFDEHKVTSAVVDQANSTIAVLIEISKDEITPIPKEDVTTDKQTCSDPMVLPISLIRNIKSLCPDVKLFKYADGKKNTDDLRYEYLWDEKTRTYRTDPLKMLTCHIDLEDNVHIISNSYIAIMGDNTVVDKLTPSGTGIRAWTTEGLITTVDEVVDIEKYVTRELELDDDLYFKERNILLEHFENIFGYEVLMSVVVDEKASILPGIIKSTKFKYDNDKEMNYFETKDGERIYFDIDDCLITKIRLDGYYSGDVSIHTWIEVDITDLEEWIDNTTQH